MRIFRTFVAVIAVFAVTTLAFAIGNTRKAEPDVRCYCEVAEPLGLVYTDTARHYTRRLFTDPVEEIITGPKGLAAVIRYGQILEIYRYGNRIRSPHHVQDDFDLFDWLGSDLIYRSGEELRVMDIKTGRSSPFPFNNARDVVTFRSGFAVIEPRDNTAVITALDMHKKPMRSWRQSGWYPTAVVSMVGKRYLVLKLEPIKNNTVLSYTDSRLWIIDLLTGQERQVKWGSVVDGCAGRNDHEILLLQGTKIKALDLATLKLSEIVSKISKSARCLGLVGLTNDKKWVVMLRGYEDVGPGRLFAVRLSDKSVRILRENVYDCEIVE